MGVLVLVGGGGGGGGAVWGLLCTIGHAYCFVCSPDWEVSHTVASSLLQSDPGLLLLLSKVRT